MRYTDPVQTKELERRASAHLAFAIASDSYYSDNAVQAMRARGFGAYSTHTKAAADALTGEDTGIALAPLSAATLAQTVSASILGRIDGVVTFALTEFLRVQAARIEGYVVGEAAAKPVSSVTFSEAAPATKAVAQLVMTSEFLRAIDEATQLALSQQLTGAAARALDEAVITALIAAASASANAQPGTLLGALGNPAKPALIGSFASLAALAGSLRDLRDLGTQVIISPAAGTRLFAVDASMFAVALAAPVVAVARDALVIMDDGGSPPSTSVLNLFQQNAVAIRSEIWARFAIAPGAVAHGTVS